MCDLCEFVSEKMGEYAEELTCFQQVAACTGVLFALLDVYKAACIPGSNGCNDAFDTNPDNYWILAMFFVVFAIAMFIVILGKLSGAYFLAHRPSHK